MGAYANYLLPVALLALMYFMLIRPQQQQQKKRQEMLNQLQAGVDIVTIGGMHGTITEISDRTVRLRVASGIELTFNRAAVGSIKEKE